jgi:hypothetical protein
MPALPRDRLLLRSKIEQQRTTIAALKRDGHETTDAERHLQDLEGELTLAEEPKSALPGNRSA